MIIPKKFSHCFESSETPHQASQPGYLAKELGILRESDFEGQWDLIAGLPQDWGKQIPLLVGTNKILCTPAQGKGAVPHRRLNQAYLLVLEGLLWGMGWQWLAVGTLHQGHWHQQSWRVPLGVSPLGVHH